MKIIYIITILSGIYTSVYSQAIVSTASGKSGILVGQTPGTKSDFVGINYESADDKFRLNYKFIKQGEEKKVGFPNFWGINVGSGAKIEKNKSSLIGDERWQGGVDFDLTIFKTWDESTLISSGTPVNGISDDKYKIRQYTLYIRFGNSLERIKTFELFKLNKDTTFASLKNPIQNNFSITPGFFGLKQWESKWFLSYGISANISAIWNSTRKLSETTLIPSIGTILNAKDSTQIFQTGKQESYFSGKSEFEIFIVPRGDLFIRRSLGENKPYIGALFSYSPLISSFESIKIRNSFAFGPTFGLYTFPDHVLFGLMNEFIQNKDGDYKYALTFNVSFPIKFK